MAAGLWAAPAISVPSEEAFFSAASDLITKRQDRMVIETAEARMCARHQQNLPELTEKIGKSLSGRNRRCWLG
jgi:hypothetical protein